MGDRRDFTTKQRWLLEAKQKDASFDDGMYVFIMFVIQYYFRVKKNLKIDYDSFIIVQVVVSHSLYNLHAGTNRGNFSYPDIKSKFNEIIKGTREREIKSNIYSTENIDQIKNLKLTISSICMVAGLPKETVRRKVLALSKKKIIFFSRKYGVKLGEKYKNFYNEFVPETTFEVIKLLKKWRKLGVLKMLLEFKT